MEGYVIEGYVMEGETSEGETSGALEYWLLLDLIKL